LFVGFDQHPAHERLAVGDLESGDAHLSEVDRTRIAGSDHEISARVAPGADVGQRSQRLLPREKVVEDLFLLNVRRHVDAANFDQARALG
jgi:hypothetical protein